MNLPPPGSSGYQAALDVNREIARRLFKRVFLARLILFSGFAETMTVRLKRTIQFAANSVKELGRM